MENLTGREFDIWFGPRLFNKKTSKYFLDYNGEYGDKWESIFIPVMDALHNNKKIIIVNDILN